MRAMYAIHRLEPMPTGHARSTSTSAPCRAARCSRAAIRLGFPTLERAYRRVLPALAAQLDRLRPEVLQLPPPRARRRGRGTAARRPRPAGRRGTRREVRRSARVDGSAPATTPTSTASRSASARACGSCPRSTMLRTALHATRAGLLELSWDMICPHCRGVRDETEQARRSSRPRATARSARSTSRPISIEAVEVTFRVHPSIRAVPERLYCSAEPATKDHIRVQRAVAPGAKAVIRPRLEPGRYTVWARPPRRLVPRRRRRRPRRADLEDHPEGTVVRASTRPGGHVRQRRRRARDVLDRARDVERRRAAPRRAAVVPGVPRSVQRGVHRRDVQLAVGEQTLLFTDVVGSTAMYASRGDPGGVRRGQAALRRGVRDRRASTAARWSRRSATR